MTPLCGLPLIGETKKIPLIKACPCVGREGIQGVVNNERQRYVA
jgi:hypothetical protein